MKILFLSRWFPYPPDNGAKLRIYHLLQGLSQKYEVHLLSFSDQPKIDAANAGNTGCHTVQTVQWKDYDPHSLRSALGLFSLTPRSLVDTYSIAMERELSHMLREQHFDLVIPSQWQMNVYRHCFADKPGLIEEIEVGSLYGQYLNTTSPQARLRASLTWWKHKRYLSQLLANEQPCTVVSEQERRLLKAIVPNNSSIHVVPNGVNLKEYENFHEEPQVNTLIFTGSFRYNPNYEAMVWFLEKVFPLIQVKIPTVQLTITGDNASLPLPHYDGMTLTGYVDDVRPLVARSWASIVPLQTGGGTRLKILESMALNTPVVSTSKGAEGLILEDGVHLEIADMPGDFASRTIRLLQDRGLRDRLALNAVQCVRQSYDWQVIMPKFLSVVERAAARGKN